jgi:hypothetical protein
MRLWTIQEHSVWRELQLQGTLYSIPELGNNFDDWRPAYEWMQAQMALRLRLGTVASPYPWWAWYAPKPDLRKYTHAKPSGQQLVRLELEIRDPASRVLLSAFSAWEMVLGGGYVGLDADDFSRWEDQLNLISPHNPDPDLSPEHKEKLIASWDRIFDIAALERAGQWSTSQVQACIDRLNIGDVIRVTAFTTK